MQHLPVKTKKQIASLGFDLALQEAAMNPEEVAI